MRIFFVCVVSLCLLGAVACSSKPVRLIPPSGPSPQTVFIFERDLPTVWNALVRATDQMPQAEIWSKSLEEGKITLRDATVQVMGNCRCGHLGENTLTGTATRLTTISVDSEAPQLTRIRIQAAYHLPFAWQNVYGRTVNEQTIECISSGRFEQDLYERTLGYLAR